MMMIARAAARPAVSRVVLDAVVAITGSSRCRAGGPYRHPVGGVDLHREGPCARRIDASAPRRGAGSACGG
jgi:hypothetical protein